MSVVLCSPSHVGGQGVHIIQMKSASAFAFVWATEEKTFLLYLDLEQE